jgi:hypothetical protein
VIRQAEAVVLEAGYGDAGLSFLTVAGLEGALMTGQSAKAAAVSRPASCEAGGGCHEQ